MLKGWKVKATEKIKWRRTNNSIVRLRWRAVDGEGFRWKSKVLWAKKRIAIFLSTELLASPSSSQRFSFRWRRKKKSFERNKRKFNLQTSAHQRDHYRPPTSTRTAPDAILKHLCGAGMGDARCRGWWLENRNSCSISAPHPNDNFFNQFPRIKTNFLPRSEGVKCWAVMAG